MYYLLAEHSGSGGVVLAPISIIMLALVFKSIFGKKEPEKPAQLTIEQIKAESQAYREKSAREWKLLEEKLERERVSRNEKYERERLERHRELEDILNKSDARIERERHLK